MTIFMNCLKSLLVAICLARAIYAAGTSHDVLLRGSERELSAQMYCKNTAAGRQTDYGCTAAYPLCADAEGYPLKDSSTFGICFKCFNDGSGQNHIDIGCSSARPRCGSIQGKSGYNCLKTANNIATEVPALPCTETSSGDGMDEGCTAEQPFCGRPSGLPTSASGQCFKCQNDRVDNSTVDRGCSEDFPACDASPLSYGKKCTRINPRTCTNSATGGRTDTGCTTTYPLCASINGSPIKDASTEGVCFRCLNSGSGRKQIDIGCITSRPNCNAPPGYHGYVCITRP